MERDGPLIAITSGGYHSCVLVHTHGVKCWGEGTYGQTGYGSPYPATDPIPVSGLAGVKSITTGGFHSCAVRTNNKTMCWGRNNNGQLGNGTTTQAMTPVPVTGA